MDQEKDWVMREEKDPKRHPGKNGAPVRGKSPKVGDEELKQLLENLTEMEKNFARILVYNRPKSNTQALIQAGSKATRTNATKLASEMVRRPNVQAYIQYLEGLRAEESGVTLEEVVGNARRAIEMAFATGKPKDAETHNRLLAELGGFIKSSPQVAVQQNNLTPPQPDSLSSLRSEALESDIRRLQQIAGVSLPILEGEAEE